MKAPTSVTGLDCLLYLVYTTASVTGLIILKWYLPAMKQDGHVALMFRKELVFVGVGASLYIASFLVWLVILSRIELSIAYPTAIGLTLVCSTLAAAAVLGEQITAVRLVGIIVVFAGIVLITRS